MNGAECPRCGVYYAKAEAKRAARAVPPSEPPAPEPQPNGYAGDAQPWAGATTDADPYASVPMAGVIRPTGATWEAEPDVDELTREFRIRLVAIPAALIAAWLLIASPLGHFFARTFFSMWLHELGHAITAWLCSISAFPGPWVTRVSDHRSFVVGLFIFTVLTAWALYSKRDGHPFQLGVALLGIGVFLIGSLGISFERAQSWFSFGGDGGGLILGTLLIAAMNAKAESRLRTGRLRWGFLAIGALTVADIAGSWFAARNDPANIPFGVIEGVGFSDASRLVEEFGWTEAELVGRYVGLSVACLVAIAAIYGYGVFRAWRAKQQEA